MPEILNFIKEEIDHLEGILQSKGRRKGIVKTNPSINGGIIYYPQIDIKGEDVAVFYLNPDTIEVDHWEELTRKIINYFWGEKFNGITIIRCPKLTSYKTILGWHEDVFRIRKDNFYILADFNMKKLIPIFRGKLSYLDPNKFR
jgi:hypothetical protein